MRSVQSQNVQHITYHKTIIQNTGDQYIMSQIKYTKHHISDIYHKTTEYWISVQAHNVTNKIYKTSDLLLSMGNANLKLNRSNAARENFTRVINLFPEIKTS